VGTGVDSDTHGRAHTVRLSGSLNGPAPSSPRDLLLLGTNGGTTAQLRASGPSALPTMEAPPMADVPRDQRPRIRLTSLSHGAG
jgi:hypothetical protein